VSFADAHHLTIAEPEDSAGRGPLRTKLARWGKGAAGRLLSRGSAPIAEKAANPSQPVEDVQAESGAAATGLERCDAGLEATAIVDAYRRGLLPEHDRNPLAWVSPPKREAIAPQELRIGAPLRRLLREQIFRVSFDQNFGAILAACGEAATAETQGSPDLARAFTALHEQGHAHSVEVRAEDGTLAGGLYGIAVGQVFFAEARFERAKKASTVALAVLHHHLCHWGFALRSARWATPAPGASNLHMVDREAFQALLGAHASGEGRVGRWAVDAVLDTYAWGGRPRFLSRRSRSGPLPRLVTQSVGAAAAPANAVLDRALGHAS